MKREKLSDEKGKLNIERGRTSNEESKEKEAWRAFIEIVTHDLSSRIFILEDVENQVFQAENIGLTPIKSP